MSMTKRAMDAENEKKETEKRKTCGCVFNWDDKFWEECPEHAAETMRQIEEDQSHN